MADQSDPVVVIGAGAAGLAVAAQLSERGIDHVVLEAGDAIAPTWRARYDSLRLHTARRLSGLPGMSIPKRFGPWVRRDDLVEYLVGYARYFGIEPEFGVRVGRVERVDDRWRLQTSAGVREAGAVVFATGYTRTPRQPDWPGLDTFAGNILHAVDYREPSAYAGKRVLVVGSGNTGAEIAVELTEVAAEVIMAVRTPPGIAPRSSFGVPSQAISILVGGGPEWLVNPLNAVFRKLTVPDLRAYGLPAPQAAFSKFKRSGVVPILDHGFVDAVRSGRITVVAGVESIDGAVVRLSDGRSVEPDAIIAAIGFRPGLEDILAGLDVLEPNGRPRVSGGETLPYAPGLYFVGINPELGGLLRQVGQEARQVAATLAVRASKGGRQYDGDDHRDEQRADRVR